jgi:hypothetical protein
MSPPSDEIIAATPCMNIEGARERKRRKDHPWPNLFYDRLVDMPYVAFTYYY